MKLTRCSDGHEVNLESAATKGEKWSMVFVAAIILITGFCLGGMTCELGWLKTDREEYLQSRMESMELSAKLHESTTDSWETSAKECGKARDALYETASTCFDELKACAALRQCPSSLEPPTVPSAEPMKGTIL